MTGKTAKERSNKVIISTGRLYKRVSLFVLSLFLAISGLGAVVNQVAHAEVGYSGLVSITPNDSGFVTDSTINDNLDAVFSLGATPIEVGNITTIFGSVEFIGPSNSCLFNGTINANGFDTYYIEIHTCSTTIPGYTYVVGSYASLTESFSGTFINQTVALIPATDITITGASTVELGYKQTYNAVLEPLNASGEVRWSVWSGIGGGSATIDPVTGELTATSVGPVTVIASVLNGPVFTKNYSVIITPDTTRPLINFISPTNGTIVGNTNLSFTLSDNVSISQYSFNINGPDTNDWSTRKWYPNSNFVNEVNLNLCSSDRLNICNEVNLPSGIYTIKLAAYDINSNRDISSHTSFVLDKDGPLITITNPTRGSFVKKALLSGKIEDQKLSFYNIQLAKLGDPNWNFSTQKQFVAPGETSVSLDDFDVLGAAWYGSCDAQPCSSWPGGISLPDGEYSIRINAYDEFGNRTIYHHDFTLDQTPPVITINPYNTSPTNQDINVTATTSEGLLNTSSILFTENGSFDFIATDDAGNSTTNTVVILNIDKDSPAIALNGDREINLLLGDEYLELGAIWTDAQDGTGDALVDNSTVNTDVAGRYVVTYNYTDKAGNVADEVVRIINVSPIPILSTTTTIVPTENTNTGEVLGDEDTKENEDTKNLDDQDGEIKGESDVKKDDEQDGFLGLDWYWWLLMLAILGGGGWWFIIGRKGRKE